MSLIIILETVRLPSGTDQYIVPRGANISRSDLRQRLSEAKTSSDKYAVVQPGTNRHGTERLIALHGDLLTEDTQNGLKKFLNQKTSDSDRLSAVIKQANQNILPSGNKLPSSELLDDWTKEAQGHFPLKSAKPTRTPGSDIPRSSKKKIGIITMFVVALICVFIFQIPDIRDAFRLPRGTPDNTKAQDGTNASSKFSDPNEPDKLLEQLEPYVNVTEDAGTSREKDTHDLIRLARLLKKVHAHTLDENYLPAETQEMNEQEAEQECWTIWDDDALQDNLAKLRNKDGINHFGLIDPESRAPLEELLPSPPTASSAIDFRKLVRDTIQLANGPITDKHEQGDAKNDPLYPYAQGHEKDFNAMLEDMPDAFEKHRSDCTFFNNDDADAAMKIAQFFKTIGFLNAGGLGFTKEPDNNFDRQDAYEKKRYTDKKIENLLHGWEKLKTGKKPQSSLSESGTQ